MAPPPQMPSSFNVAAHHLHHQPPPVDHHPPRIKICVLGCAAVGKTQLIHRFVHGDFDAAYGASKNKRNVQPTTEETPTFSPGLAETVRLPGKLAPESEVTFDVPVAARRSRPPLRISSMAATRTRTARSRTVPAPPNRASQSETVSSSATTKPHQSSSRSGTPGPSNYDPTVESRPSSTIAQTAPTPSVQPLSSVLTSSSGPSVGRPIALSSDRTTVAFNGRLFELDVIELPELNTLPRDNASEWALFRRAFLRTVHAYILVFDLSLPVTFQHVKALHDQLCEMRPMSGVPVWVLGNKADLCLPLMSSQRSHHHHHPSKTKKIAPVYEMSTGTLGASSADETVMHSILHPHLVSGTTGITGGAPPPCPFDDLTPAFKDVGAIVRKQWKCSYLECSAKYNWRITSVFREIVKSLESQESFQSEHHFNAISSHHRSPFSTDRHHHQQRSGSSGGGSGGGGGGLWEHTPHRHPDTPTRRLKMCVIF